MINRRGPLPLPRYLALYGATQAHPSSLPEPGSRAWAPRKSLLLPARSTTRRWRTTASPHLRIEGTSEHVHAVGYLWLNVPSRYLPQWLLAHTLHMVACRPTILILAAPRSKERPEDRPFLD